MVGPDPGISISTRILVYIHRYCTIPGGELSRGGPPPGIGYCNTGEFPGVPVSMVQGVDPYNRYMVGFPYIHPPQGAPLLPGLRLNHSIPGRVLYPGSL